DPTFSISSSSTLNLLNNDLIVHTGSSDTSSTGHYGSSGGGAEWANVQGMVTLGRHGGAWDGHGLTSSAAANQDNNVDGYETIQLAVVDNADLGEPFSAWTVGAASETLGANDIIV